MDTPRSKICYCLPSIHFWKKVHMKLKNKYKKKFFLIVQNIIMQVKLFQSKKKKKSDLKGQKKGLLDNEQR